ncbi:DUF1127 domain-containing protein [uncultured Jannaschia sp.]|uniref:DUF1127 domain-containing protein n=1 Tax=uncultured Jannaschia sp. TaxID=293347 RepID=UPI00262474F1|nr:DUF1127 domain-containing protein [uncultured Jannaschia sp.]
MATFDTFRTARSAPATNVLSAVLGRIIAWNDRRVTVNMLERLTDRELYDIGLERGDIAHWSRGA